MHALRHYFASVLPAAGASIPAPWPPTSGTAIRAFTLRTYTYLMPDAADRMRQAVDDEFAASDGPVTAQQGAR